MLFLVYWGLSQQQRFKTRFSGNKLHLHSGSSMPALTSFVFLEEGADCTTTSTIFGTPSQKSLEYLQRHKYTLISSHTYKHTHHLTALLEFENVLGLHTVFLLLCRFQPYYTYSRRGSRARVLSTSKCFFRVATISSYNTVHIMNKGQRRASESTKATNLLHAFFSNRQKRSYKIKYSE